MTDELISPVEPTPASRQKGTAKNPWLENNHKNLISYDRIEILTNIYNQFHAEECSWEIIRRTYE